MVKTLSLTGFSLFALWLFALGMPVNVIYGYNTLLSVIGSAIFSISFTLAAVAFSSMIRKSSTPVNGFMRATIFIIFVFLSFFCLNSYGRKRIEDEFTKFGTKTVATITGGALYYSSQQDEFTVITVKYRNKKAEEVVANVEMLPDKYYNFQLDQKVAVLYSEKHQDMVRITGAIAPVKQTNQPTINLPFNDDKQKEKERKIGRLLSFMHIKHLIDLVELEDNDQVMQYLTSSCGKAWKLQEQFGSKGYFYHNETTGASLTRNGKAVVYIPELSSESENLTKEAVSQGFIKVENQTPGVEIMLLKGNYMFVVLNQDVGADENHTHTRNLKIVSVYEQQ